LADPFALDPGEELDRAVAAIMQIRSSGEEFRKAWKEFTKTSFKAVGFAPPPNPVR